MEKIKWADFFFINDDHCELANYIGGGVRKKSVGSVMRSKKCFMNLAK